MKLKTPEEELEMFYRLRRRGLVPNADIIIDPELWKMASELSNLVDRIAKIDNKIIERYREMYPDWRERE